MPTDYTGREPETSATDAEGVLFPTNPVWERGRKRRGFGGRKAAPATTTRAPETRIAPEPRVAPETRIADEPRSFVDNDALMASDAIAADPDMLARDRMAPSAATMTPSTLAAEETAFVAAPPPRAVRRTTSAKSDGGVSPVAIATGVAAVAILAGVGWFAMRPQEGVTQMTPGQPTPSEVAAAPLSPAPPVIEQPVRTAAVEPRTTELRPVARSVTPAQVRVRPASRASAASAASSGTNASATLPDGPQPYATANPGAAPTQVTPPAPTQVTPAAPAPTETAPTQVTPPASTTTPQAPTTEAPPPVEPPPSN